MKKLNFPEYNFSIKSKENRNYIFDILRRKYVVLTPEEWVRQHLVWALVENGYSKNYIRSEFFLKNDKLNKRCDLIVFDKKSSVFLVAECKSFKVSINQNTFDQLLQYNYNLDSKYFLITNGLSTHIFKIIDNKIEFLNDLPKFEMG